MMYQNKLLFMLCFFALSLTVSAQNRTIHPSDEVSTKSYDFTGFTSLELSNDFKAYVVFSDGPDAIRIEANENLHQYITVEMNDNTLSIHFRNNMNIKGNEVLKAYISTSNLRNFKASGDSEIFLENTLNTSEAIVNLSGDSKWSGDVAVKKLSVNLRGDSVIELKGTAATLEAKLRGDSTLDDFNFTAGEADLHLRGDSVAHLSVSGKMKANLDGDSELHYKGNPELLGSWVRGDSEMKRH